MNNSSNILSKDQLENMLPDYAFGQLSPEEKFSFENSIKNFPELQKELADIRSAFGTVQKEEYRDFTAQATKNLSVKVLSRLEKNSSEKKNFYVRYLMPGFGAALAIALVMMPGGLKEKFSLPAPNDEIIFSSSPELDNIIKEYDSELIRENSLAEVSAHKIAESVKDEMELAQVLHTIVSDELIQSVNNIENTEIIPITPTASSNELIDQLNDDDVEQVLKDLNDVDFS